MSEEQRSRGTRLSAHVTRLTLPVDTLPPYDHTNAYLVADAGVAVLVDPGSRAAVALEIVAEAIAAS